MRSRYTAHVKRDFDHIMGTHDPATRGAVDEAQTGTWAQQSEWRGLTIIETKAGGLSDQDGTVTFAARYHARGKDMTHHEVSRFRKIDGRWFYVDGRTTRGAPVRAEAKPERNAACPCGSGSKYKRCHGA